MNDFKFRKAQRTKYNRLIKASISRQLGRKIRKIQRKIEGKLKETGRFRRI